MAETATLLTDEVFPDVPLRQWVISFPFPLRYLFAAHPQAMGKILGIVYRAISTHLIHKAGYQLKDGATGAVTLIQRFGSALNLNILCGAPHKMFHVKSCVMWSNAGIAVCKSR
jgi:hypothetical protein